MKNEGFDKVFLNTETGFYSWQKGTDIQIGDFFRTKEFECHCSHKECNIQSIHFLLVEKLDAIRGELGKPIKVTSGFRCKRHQDDLRRQGLETASGVSQHELGRAADISSRLMTPLFDIAKKYFMAIGAARTFLHVDLRDDKVRAWGYRR
jgi:hypothetical protein